jgi:hypothetical protein
MGYDLETINQAWYIACDESVDAIQGMEDGAAMLYILNYARRHWETLLRDAVRELNSRRVGERL